jgi:hypothetical protein
MTTFDMNGAGHDQATGHFTGQLLDEADPTAILGGGVSADGTTWRQSADLSVEHRDPDGRLHRTDGPAVIWPDGSRFWFRHGRMHRTDGPAVERPDGTREWLIDGVHHRDDGPAMEIPATGQSIFYSHGVVHRDDGPAIVGSDGQGSFFYHGIFCPDREAFDEMRG